MLVAQVDELFLVAEQARTGHGDARDGAAKSELDEQRHVGRVLLGQDDRAQRGVDAVAHCPQVAQRVHVRAVHHLQFTHAARTCS